MNIKDTEIFSMGINEGELWIGITQDKTYSLRFDKEATKHIIQFFKVYEKVGDKNAN